MPEADYIFSIRFLIYIVSAVCRGLRLRVVVCLVLGMWNRAARICCLARAKLWHIDCQGDNGGCRDLQLSPAVDRQGGVSARVG